MTTVSLIKNPNNFNKSKHFDIRQNFVREQVEDNLVSLEKVSSQDNTKSPSPLSTCAKSLVLQNNPKAQFPKAAKAHFCTYSVSEGRFTGLSDLTVSPFRPDP